VLLPLDRLKVTATVTLVVHLAAFLLLMIQRMKLKDVNIGTDVMMILSVVNEDVGIIHPLHLIMNQLPPLTVTVNLTKDDEDDTEARAQAEADLLLLDDTNH